MSSAEGQRTGPLSPYRVLDLADEWGLLCGLTLADLGADVVAVEPPGGNRARRLAPFAGDAEGDPEASLWWASYARNRRSLVLDIESHEGRERLRELVRGADFLIESFRPGYMDRLGLGYDALSEINPQLVYVSVTPFGSSGPKAGYEATDLVVMAASGPLAVTGDADRPPLRMGVPQSFLHAGAEAACGALIAHRERLVSGRGQHVDVSAQQATAAAMQSFILTSAIGEKDLARVTGGVSISGITLPLVWRAKDGYVSVTFFFGNAMGPFSRRLMEWMYEEGACDEAMRDKDWIGYALLLLNGEEPEEEYQRVLAAVAEFVRGKTKQELLEEAIKRRLLIVPISTIGDLNESPQFEARGYWQNLYAPSLGREIRTPGAFAKLSATPLAHHRGAPRIGEHSEEVPGSWPDAPGFAGPGREPQATERRLPLEGLKVLDFMWVIAGPTATRTFADYGATVIKVESTTSVDTARGFQPFKDGTPGPESSGLFQNMNAGKFGLTLNLAKEEGRAVARDLVRWADVVCESFSPRAMRNWGLDYESLRAIKPEIIMLSTCLFGQSGPYSSIAGFGTMGAAVGGFNSLVGWPDRDPAMASAYTDYIAPRYTIPAILAALDHRDRTGEGQYIDLSQAEAGINFLTPALLDLVVNGREFERRGNADLQMSPHAVFPAAGEDRWVAIACRDEADWQALLEVAGLQSLGSDPRFSTLAARLANREALEEEISRWTRQHPMDEIERVLQERGVPAHQVQNSSELLADPQLLHRGHFIRLPHAMLGEFTVENSRFRLSRTPGRVERPGPTFGEHNDFVLREILGYDDERIAQLVMEDVLV